MVRRSIDTPTRANRPALTSGRTRTLCARRALVRWNALPARADVTHSFGAHKDASETAKVIIIAIIVIVCCARRRLSVPVRFGSFVIATQQTLIVVHEQLYDKYDRTIQRRT